MGEFNQINKRKKDNIIAKKKITRIKIEIKIEIKRNRDKKAIIIEKKIKRIAIEKERIIRTREKEARVILS